MSPSKKGKTSVMWNYFTIIDPAKKIASCNHCGQPLAFFASTSNLKKHIERLHRDIPLPGSKIIKKRDASSSKSKITEKRKSENNDDVDMQYDNDNFQSPSISLELTSHENEENHNQCSDSSRAQTENDSQNESNLSMNSHVPQKGRRSILWKHFTIINEEKGIACCNHCGQSLAFLATTSNLKKHIERLHKDIPLPGCKMIKEKDISLPRRKVIKRKNISLLRIKLTGRSKPEPENNDDDQVLHESGNFQSPSISSALTPYDNEEDHNRCSGSSEIQIESDAQNESDLPLNESMNSYVPQKNNRRSILWKHFTIIDKEKGIACCNHCGQSLAFLATTSNLKKHIERLHKDIPLPGCKMIKEKDVSLPRRKIMKRKNISLLRIKLTGRSKPEPENNDDDQVLHESDNFQSPSISSALIPCDNEEDHNRCSGSSEVQIESDAQNESDLPLNESMNSHVLQKDNRRSILWKHFTIIDKEKGIACCNHCGQSLAFLTTTSNLKKHIERLHKDIPLPGSKITKNKDTSLPVRKIIKKKYKSLPGSKVTKKIKPENIDDIDIQYDSDNPLSPPISFALTPCENEENHNRHSGSSRAQTKNDIQNLLDLTLNEPTKSVQQQSSKKLSESQKLDKLLLQLFIQHLHPYSMVEEEAFLNFVNGLNLSYKLPNKKTLTNVLIPAEYDKCLIAARRELQAVKSACLSIDIWKSENLNIYMNLTAHYINDAFELSSILLGCTLMPPTYTSVDFLRLVQRIAVSFKFHNEVSLIVSDNSCDIKDEVCKELKVEHFDCFAHTLNVILQDALKTANELLSKIRSIIKYFRSSSSVLDKLKSPQNSRLILDPKKLVQENSKSWNSTFYMIQRFSELQDAIKTTTESIDEVEDMPILTEDEWMACKELSTVLEPFDEVAEEICEEQYVIGSLIIPLTNGLRSVCEIMQEEEFGPIAKCVIVEILNGINTRMRNVEDNKSLALATFLDPRFKLASFSDEFKAKSIKEHCTKLIDDIWTQSQLNKSKHNSSQSDSSNNSPSAGRLVKFSVWDKLDKSIASKKPSGSTSAALLEINRYIEDTFLGRKEDPLLWWKRNQYSYPLMTKLVKTKFNVVGTSLPADRLFTKAGNEITERRSRLRTKNMEKLLFLNANSFLIN